MKNFKYTFFLLAICAIFNSCNTATSSSNKLKTDDKGFAILSDEQVENIVKRSYQYVAMYNVNNKFARSQGGWNTLNSDTKLKDHSLRNIARPNNDTFYSSLMLDLRKDAFVVNLPKFDSKYVSLMVVAYDHYVHVPKAKRLGDFEQTEKILFYSDRTENYKGESIEGIDEIFKANGDFIAVVFRVMPHANDPERFEKVIGQIGEVSLTSLSEIQGKEAIAIDDIEFPAIGESDLDIYENNFLEVMQFILNHLSFDRDVEMDKELLAAFKPLGIEPGNTYNAETAVKIDGKRLMQVADEVRKENLLLVAEPSTAITMGPRIFKPKGETDLEAVLAVSVSGPSGLPLEEAFYRSISTTDGSLMNASNDYVIKMAKDEMPPARAFWSLTLYDKANGFFIPNDYKKYSVGENAGMQLNEDGGIEVYVSVEKPDGVPAENWLPIRRVDEDLDVVLRLYVPELEKLQEWSPPIAEVIQ